jgi:hypothetical protein
MQKRHKRQHFCRSIYVAPSGDLMDVVRHFFVAEDLFESLLIDIGLSHSDKGTLFGDWSPDRRTSWVECSEIGVLSNLEFLRRS